MNWFETYARLKAIADDIALEIEYGSGSDGLIGPCTAIRALVADPAADWAIPRPEDVHEAAHVLKRAYGAYTRDMVRRDIRRSLGDPNPGAGISETLDKYDHADAAFDEVLNWKETD